MASLSHLRLSKAHTLRVHRVLQSQSATGTYFLCFAKESKQRKATRARIGPRCPRSVVSQTIKLFVSLPHSVRLNGVFKPQINERGTASIPNLIRPSSSARSSILTLFTPIRIKSSRAPSNIFCDSSKMRRKENPGNFK